uniref:Leucine-rich repeat flightless-interacting protein 1 n=1 Tax=Micrurus lemniscatus lemniscatus TaxID=129467 RepID=A0A2D4HFB8_MICLE
MENAGTTPQGVAGRKRIPNRERPTAEDEALNLIAREGEARLAAKRAARAEAREIRMKELEKQQKEVSDEDDHVSVHSRGSLRVEERSEKDFEKGIRTASSLSAATVASLGGTFSRRGSGDTSISIDTEASIREIKDSSAEVEEKYKKAMVSNAQLDNEKTNFMYQVETLQDALLELEEQLAESKRQFEEKSKDFEREKHAHAILQFQFMELKEALKQKEELLAEIRQLQQKQEGFVREITDLQETVEWKEKKIGALERQKVFFDSLRSERDDLREEVILLKEQLKVR